jgi:hypothetical protein
VWQSLCCHLPPLIRRFAPPSPRVAGRRMEVSCGRMLLLFVGATEVAMCFLEGPSCRKAGQGLPGACGDQVNPRCDQAKSLSEDRLWQAGATLDHPWITGMLRFNPAMRPVTTTGFQCPARQIPLARRARQSHSSASSRCSPTGKSGRCRCRSPMSAPCWP